MKALLGDMKNIMALLLGLMTLFSVIVASIVAWVKLTEKQKTQDVKIKENSDGVEGVLTRLTASLYNGKSMPIFMPKESCEEMREICSKQICSKIESLSVIQQSGQVEVKQELKEVRSDFKIISTSIALITQSVSDFKEYNEKAINEIKEEIQKRNNRS